MTSDNMDLYELHWLMDVLQNIDVGLVVLDNEFRIQLWNTFMQNHSGLHMEETRDQSLFELFDEIPEDWLRHKIESTYLLKCRAFSTWEQRPYVFRFKNYRPITGTAEYMYQNMTIIPLESIDGTVRHVCLIIYDVTDIAINKMESQAMNKRLAKISRTDGLTRLFNRVYWEECLQREFLRGQRNKTVSSLVMFDIDHFKQINDTYGHQAGDAVIRRLAELLRENARNVDISGRYGGEEFAVILFDTDANNSQRFAERIRRNVEQEPFSLRGNPVRITISAGIAEYADSLADYKHWIDRADKALYQAKEFGRNQTRIYISQTEESAKQETTEQNSGDKAQPTQ